MKKGWCAPACAGLVFALVACDAGTNSENVVARVGSHELMVDEVVELLVNEERLSADVGVVESLSNLWIDYTLLAEALAEDTTLADLDFEPLVRQQLAQVMVFQLRDSVIQVDTFVTEDELMALYEAEAPELEIRARHIMFQYPFQATPAQRDSVRVRLEGIREQILAGASFEVLARQYSQDPGSGAAGGDLGFFRRGDMVLPFEEAALALEPGQVSEVVESPMGLHLIRLEERRIQGFALVAPQFRREVQARMVAEAESVFVARLVDRVDPKLTEGAVEVTREIASSPGTRLSGRAARRPLLEWEGGSVTVGGIQEILQVEAPALRAQVMSGTEEEVGEFLLGLGRRALLIREAQAAGLQPSGERVDSLVADAAAQLRRAARALGLFDLDQAPGEPLEIAIARAVEEALNRNLTGATQVVPLGLVGFQLRAGSGSALYDAGTGRAIVQIAQLRATRTLSPLEQAIDSASAAVDTLGP